MQTCTAAMGVLGSFLDFSQLVTAQEQSHDFLQHQIFNSVHKLQYVSWKGEVTLCNFKATGAYMATKLSSKVRMVLLI